MKPVLLYSLPLNTETETPYPTCEETKILARSIDPAVYNLMAESKDEVISRIRELERCSLAIVGIASNFSPKGHFILRSY